MSNVSFDGSELSYRNASANIQDQTVTIGNTTFQRADNTEEAITPTWLEPIGDTGLYITPGEPADPLDCDRYPNSPWCGGDLANWDDIASLSPISNEGNVQFGQDEVCATLTTTVFGIGLPPVTVCYRGDDAPPMPERPQLGGFDNAQWYPLPRQEGGGRECVYGWTIGDSGNPTYETDILVGEPLGYFVKDRNVLYREKYPNLHFPPQDPYEWNIYYTRIFSYTITIVGAVYVGMRDPLTPSYIWDMSLSTLEIIWNFSKEPFVSNVELISCSIPNPTRNLPPPRPSLPPYPEDDMSCNCNELLQLLRLIALRMGVDEYPVKVPENVIAEDDKTEQHQSLTTLLGWVFKQMDALNGQYPLKIKVKDIDPIQEGDQEKEIKIPNAAEALAEMYGLQLRGSINSDVIIEMLLRLSSEIMQIKNAAIVTQDYSKANADFLGYKGKSVQRKIQSNFDVENIADIAKFMKTTEKQVISWKCDDDDSLVEYLRKLMFSAGIIKAVFWRSRQDAENLINQFREYIDDDSDYNQDRDREFDEWIRQMNSETSQFNLHAPTYPKIDKLTTQPSGETTDGDN